MKNRDFIITDGKDERTVIAECSHCNEPITLEYTGNQLNKPDGSGSLAENREIKMKFYCRGSSGLSIYTRCCYELNCQKKKGNLCDLKPKQKETYEINKSWSVIVVEKTAPIDSKN